VEVRVHGKHMQVGDELREMVAEGVARAGRIFEQDGSIVDVEFAERRNPRRADDRYRVEITTVISGHVVRVEGSAPDERSAFDTASEKYERSLRKLKTRLIQRTRTDDHKRLNDTGQPAEEGLDTDEPQIVRVKQFAMKPMLPQEAVLQMELLDHSFFFFLNGETNRYGVLYRRRDGSLGLIEPA
jgi:putative sigma-54 modulation protein